MAQVTLPGVALADETRPVTTITCAKPGPVLFFGAGVRGGECPAVETVIRLSTALDAAAIACTVVQPDAYLLTEGWWLYRLRATFTGRLPESSADSIHTGISRVVARRTGLVLG